MATLQSGVATWLASDYRFAGDDWTGDNALTYGVFVSLPVYAADGVTVVTPGVPRDLTGCTVTGTLRYQGDPGPGVAPGSVMPIPVGAVLDAANGVVALSLPSARTIFPRQPFGLTDPSQALLLVQPRIVGPQGAVTVGLQPLFVF